MLDKNLNNLYHSLHRLLRQMHRIAHHKMHKKHEIYRGQASLLLLILNNDGITQRELVEQLDIRASSITEVVTKMEQTGLVIRKHDEKDQRVMHIHLTDEGKKVAEQLVDITDKFTNLLFAPLTEEEKEQLSVIIEKLCVHLETIDVKDDDINHKSKQSFHAHHNRLLKHHHIHNMHNK